MYNKFILSLLAIIFEIIKIPLLGVRYFCIGLFLVMYYTLSSILEIGTYFGKGLFAISYIVRKCFFYLFYGLSTPFLLLIYLEKKLSVKVQPALKEKRNLQKKQEQQMKQQHKEEIKKKQAAELQQKQQRALEKEKLERAKDEKKRLQEIEMKKAKEYIAEEKERKRIEARNKPKKKATEEAYINKNVKLDKKKKNLGKQLKNSFSSFFGRLKNNSFARNRKNRKDLNRQVLLLNFEGDDAKKSDQKVLYEYVAKTPDGDIIKGHSEAFSRVEVHSYLLSEGYEVYSIKTNWWIRFLHKQAGGNKTKFKTGDLIFLITQLSTYLKAGITLVEALRILSRQYKKKSYQRILKSLVYDLTMGDNLSDAMEKQGVAFPRLLINMVKTAEMTGELPEVLDDMVEYYSEMEQTRKQMISALTYPSLVFVFAIAVVTFMLVFVIPQFTDIYASMEGVKIPAFTLFVMSVSAFLRSYSLWVLLGIIAFSFIFILFYRKVRGFRTVVQWIVMHVPVIGNTIIYNEVTNFTKTFSSLLAHSVFITDSMDILVKITNNEIYKMMIYDTVANLAKGDKISAAFKNHWAFPLPAYEMLVTGETTGELPEMMRKVSNYYQMLHKESVNRIKTFIEPILTIFLTVIVGTIILAIIIPMFGMYQSIQEL